MVKGAIVRRQRTSWMDSLERPDQMSNNNASVGDSVRRRNLSEILVLVHESGPLNRAELTRESGLNRSTIARLVVELANLDLIRESEPRDTGVVGRPSPVIRANDDIVAVCINPDIDAVAVALIGLGGEIRGQVRRVTTSVPSVEDMILLTSRVIKELIEEIEGDLRIIAAGIAVPGIVRVDLGVVEFAPHLGWTNEPVAQLMRERLGYPTFVANDANLGIIAERLYGMARGKSDVIYLNGSGSGIGGGVIVNDRPLTGTHGFGAELGHTSTSLKGVPCYCGRRGCLETEVSLARLLSVVGQSSIDPDDLGLLIGSSNHRALRREADRQLDILAVAISNFISVFNPEIVVLAGFLGGLLEMNPTRLREHVVHNSFHQLSSDVKIVRASLHSQHLLVGAAELAFSGVLNDPITITRTST
jgi:predicted NBD/HSP70 family sugar kinase